MFKYFKPYILRGVFASLFKMGESIADLSLPFFMAKIIDIGVGNRDSKYIIQIACVMILVAIMGYVSSIISNYLSATASQRFGSNLREEVFIKTQYFPFDRLNAFGSSSLITRITKDINQITQMFLMCIRMVLRGLTTGVGAVIMAFLINPKLSIIFIIIAPFIVSLTTFYVKKTFRLYKIVQNKLDKLTLVLRENLLGVKVVKALGKENVEEKRFDNINQELKDDTIKADKVMLSKLPFISLTMNVGIVAVLWFGGISVHYGNLQVGEVVAFINYLNMTLFAMNALSFLFSLYSKTSVSYGRVKEILDENIIDSAYLSEIDMEKENAIEFKNVYFSYAGNSNYALENINFSIKKGEHIGIIGSIGSGKSTLLMLINKFYKPTEGEIKIFGENILNIKDEFLHKKIGVVMQTAVLFSQSIRENIGWGDVNANISEIQEVSQIAQAHDFIQNFENKYESLLNQRGSNLSGGQRQRVSIARTLLKHPDILIMDDSFSAVDLLTERKLKKDLDEYLEKATTLVVSSKISTLINMDKIIVMDSGKIVGFDNHENLVKNCDIYREICISQEVCIGDGFDERNI